MAKALPDRFNPDLMARDGTRHEAVLPVARFGRLAAMLAPVAGGADAVAGADEAAGAGSVVVSATFSRREDHIVVAGRLRAGFALQCQRCLEPMVLDVDEPYELTFVESEAAAQALPDELDPVVVDDTNQITLVALCEDELILHVPLVARHPEGVRCAPAAASFGGEGIDPDAADAAENGRRRPFDALKDLDLH